MVPWPEDNDLWPCMSINQIGCANAGENVVYITIVRAEMSFPRGRESILRRSGCLQPDIVGQVSLSETCRRGTGSVDDVRCRVSMLVGLRPHSLRNPTYKAQYLGHPLVMSYRRRPVSSRGACLPETCLGIAIWGRPGGLPPTRMKMDPCFRRGDVTRTVGFVPDIPPEGWGTETSAAHENFHLRGGAPGVGQVACNLTL